MKNPQTTIALTFLTHIISDIDGVSRDFMKNIPKFASYFSKVSVMHLNHIQLNLVHRPGTSIYDVTIY